MYKRWHRQWLLVVALAGTAAVAPSCDEPDYACDATEAQRLYEQRIAPVLTDDRPKSCNQCHLSGVDLSIFVKGDPCQTMACMVDRGIVDLANPDNSLVLSWIARASPQSEGITDTIIQEEYDGFREWIVQAATCGQPQCPSYDNPCELDKPDPDACELISIDNEWQPFDDPGGCDDRVIEEMFQNDFYAFRGRCHPCHWSSEEGIKEAPKWLQIGDCDVSSLATLREIERRGYIDTAEPMKSLILLKPLAEDLGGVDHGGGPKFHDEDEQGYQAFVHFLKRYAECKQSD